jgi:malonyl CoA-acyl carrier protein transacylase
MRVTGFPGQGAQTKGMGAELFGRYPDLLAQADEILGYSVAELCLENRDGRLTRTRYAQPALYTVGVLSLLRHRESDPEPPDYYVGHSLGEYVALHAAGVFDFATGLRLVRCRGILMSRSREGAMAAVLGLSLEQVRALIDEAGLEELDVALHNAPGQFALSGPAESIDRLVSVAAESEVRCVRLNVSGPFHSRSMRPCAEAFGDYLGRFALSAPRVPVLANTTGRPHRTGQIAAELVRQIHSPVLWMEGIRYLTARDDIDFTELGPGRTLTGMVERIVRERALPEPAPAP